MGYSILLVKETRAGEKRVALTPQVVGELISQGHIVFIESDAGLLAGYKNSDYAAVGAQIRYLRDESQASYRQLFNDITHIVRVKRPAREREIKENQVIARGSVMIGALDPLEKHSAHLDEYNKAGIEIHSIDQLSLPVDHPMNILSAMSRIAGRLALVDAISKHRGDVNKVVIIGFGVAGQSAFHEALKRNLPVTVILRDEKKAEIIVKNGGHAVLFNKDAPLSDMQIVVKDEVKNASIVISSVRKNNEPAPLLIPVDTLQSMQQNTVVVDLALSEGGNVEGSQHDATLLLGNQIIVTNVSGYPKSEPRQASMLWSQASLLYLQQLSPSIRAKL